MEMDTKNIHADGTDNAQIQDIWKEYSEELYNKTDKSTNEEIVLEETHEDNMGPDILYSHTVN